LKLQPHSWLTAVAALALLPAATAAQSLRCRGDLVSTGDSRADVLLKCGEPVLKDSFCKPVSQPVPGNPTGATIANVVPCENVDEWTYNPGYGQFMTTLRFEGGKVAAITYGDRVK
jgi:hypothetical protein